MFQETCPYSSSSSHSVTESRDGPVHIRAISPEPGMDGYEEEEEDDGEKGARLQRAQQAEAREQRIVHYSFPCSPTLCLAPAHQIV